MKKKWKKRLFILVAVLAVVVLGYFFLMPTVNFIAGIYNNKHHKNILSSKNGKTARNYYVSANGDDNNEGKTLSTAWKTIEKLNAVEFNPGDSVLFEGGQNFSGNFKLDEKDLGTYQKPVYIGSYGNGWATIMANDGSAINSVDGEHLYFSRLMLKGSGAKTNKGNGLAIINSMRGNIRLSNIRIDSIEASGFHYNGILMEGKKTKSGFDTILITNSSVHDNGDAGMYVKGNFQLDVGRGKQYAHSNVTVRNVSAFNNPGLPDSKDNTGSGIVLSDVSGGLVEKCVAYNNGALCTSQRGGPVGIWTWDAKDVIIQYCESYANKTNCPYDGGGFDLDGGSVNCILQYNYSHDNDGSGFFLAQFYWARKHTGNIIRYNISENDGRKNGYAGLDVWGKVENAIIHNNTVVVNTAPLDTANAIFIRPNWEMGWDKLRFPENVTIANNILVTSGNVNLVESNWDVKGIKFLNNNYYSTTSTPLFRWAGKTYWSLDNWRTATGQEKKGSQSFGIYNDPQFASAQFASSADQKLWRFSLHQNSFLIDKAIDVTKEFQSGAARIDFGGISLPQGAAHDIGAFELAATSKMASE